MHSARFARFVGVAIFLCSTLSSVPAFAQIDFYGQWGQRYYEDQEERAPGGELGDYTGLPLNDAARMRAETWDAAIYGLNEWQCRPHSAVYMWRSVHPARIWKELEPVTGEVIAIHANFHDLIERVVYMDGRPHPPDPIPTWWGHSIGKFEKDTLVIDTIGYNDKFWFDSNGTPHTEQLHTVERWTRINWGRITNDFLLDDPGAFSRPVNLKFTGRLLRPDLKTGGGELMEFICLEGNEYGSAAGFVPGQGTSIK